MSKFKIAKQIVNNNENCRNGCGFGCLIYFLTGAISSLICFIIEHMNLSDNVVLCLEYIISALVWIIIILSIMIYSRFKLFKELRLTFCYEKSEWYQQTKTDLSELLDKGAYGEYFVFVTTPVILFRQILTQYSIVWVRKPFSRKKSLMTNSAVQLKKIKTTEVML